MGLAVLMGSPPGGQHLGRHLGTVVKLFVGRIVGRFRGRKRGSFKSGKDLVERRLVGKANKVTSREKQT